MISFIRNVGKTLTSPFRYSSPNLTGSPEDLVSDGVRDVLDGLTVGTSLGLLLSSFLLFGILSITYLTSVDWCSELNNIRPLTQDDYYGLYSIIGSAVGAYIVTLFIAKK